MTRKGIYFSFDAVIASIIFILTIISLLSYWYGVRETVMAEEFVISEEALRISNLLFLPSSDGFGFAVSYEDKSLDMDKVEDYLDGYTIDELKAKMKEDVSTPYDFQVVFEIYDQTLSSGHLLLETTYEELGEKPPEDSIIVSKVVRIASTSDGKIAIVSVYLYE